MHRTKVLILIAVLAVFGILMAACTAATPAAPAAPAQPQAPQQPAAPAAPAPTCEAPKPCPAAAPTGPAAPNQDAWAKSPHNDAKSEAFKHWDTTNDKAVPAACAQCHSTTGYQDFLGADGSAAGKVDKNVPIGETVQCAACHNDKANALTSVKFLSEVEVKNLGPEARCMVCHQGRATQKQIDDQIAKFKATDLDKPVEPLKDGDKTVNFSFINAHYFTAALTLYGGEVKGGYQYEGQSYDVKNQHVDGYDTCVSCHNPHTTEVKVEKCAECHEGAKTVEDLKKVRMVSSAMDYNGNGDVKEGMAAEIAGMQTVLMKAIQSYAKDVAGMGIVYDPQTYPYFLQDKGNTGTADKDDKGAAIAYGKWTPRLLKAAFNYQISVKDPGAYAHNPKYIVELLYDSTADLNTKLATKIDMSKMSRMDAGHFAGSEMAFRDWDETGEVPAGCAKCHSAGGLPQFIHNGGTLALTKAGLQVTGVVGQPPANGFKCTTCHAEEKFPARLAVVNVPFPSGATLTFSTEKDDKGNLKPVDANLCIECHQGRESTLSVNNALAAFKEADKPDAKIRFRNVHYFAAGATLFGTSAKGIYEYDGKTYAGQNMHTDKFNTCTDCHDAHTLEVNAKACAGCHKVDDPAKIRMTKENYDGSKDAAEPMAQVVENFKTRLYAGIQKYATTKAKVGILYDAASYPYFFVDKDGDGKADKDDKGAVIAYNAFTPRLLKAAYNYQYSMKDPGVYAHNPKYVLQALYDSIQDIGGDVTGLTRPK
jgi:hypothetical protein